MTEAFKKLTQAELDDVVKRAKVLRNIEFGTVAASVFKETAQALLQTLEDMKAQKTVSIVDSANRGELHQMLAIAGRRIDAAAQLLLVPGDEFGSPALITAAELRKALETP